MQPALASSFSFAPTGLRFFGAAFPGLRRRGDLSWSNFLALPKGAF